MSVSVNRARRAQTPRTARMASVTTAVITGKCQNSHTMVAADSAKIANSATIFVRACATSRSCQYSPDRVPNSEPLIQGALLNDHTVKTHLTPGLNYPSMVSRRQCRAVNTINTSARLSDAAADTHTSSAATGSSLSTLVISKCWLKRGDEHQRALGFQRVNAGEGDGQRRHQQDGRSDRSAPRGSCG